MNHSEAIQATAVAAYLRGDLSGAERDAFEVHTIDCPICAEAVWTGVKAAAEAPTIPQPLPKPLPFRERGRQWLATAAAAVFAFVLGGQLIPTASRMPAFSIASVGGSISGIVRGSEDNTINVHFEGNRMVEIIVTITSEKESFTAYEIELLDASANVLHKENLTPKQALHRDGFVMLLSPLPAGRYEVATFGVRKDGNRQEVVPKKKLVVQ